LEPSRPALCETISAVDGPRGVRLKRDLRGLATVRAHRVIHLTRAAVEAASSSASVFVHSLPTIQALQGTDGRLSGPIPHKAAHPAAPVLVVPEVDVFPALDRLHAEATTDLHASGMELPLLKGNHRVHVSCVAGVHMPRPARPGDGPMPPVRRGDVPRLRRSHEP